MRNAFGPVTNSIALGVLLVTAGGCVTRTGVEKESLPGEITDIGPVFREDKGQIVHDFTVRNTTNDHIQILNEVHSCTCTNIEIDRAALPPGGSTRLRMTVTVPQELSKFDLQCTVKTDYARYPDWDYRLRFSSIPPVRMSPHQIHLGVFSHETDPSVSRSEDAHKDDQLWFECFAPNQEHLPSLESITVHGGVYAESSGPAEVALFQEGVWRARYPIAIRPDDADGSNGTFSGSVSCTSSKGDSASATVSWRRKGLLDVSPSRIHFGVVGRGIAAGIKKIIISTSDQRDFRLLSADGGVGGARAKPQEGQVYPTAESKHHTVELTLDIPNEQAGRALSGVVKFATDLESTPILEVPWSAFLRERD